MTLLFKVLRPNLQNLLSSTIMKSMEEQVIRISVRALVEFILQSGDIDNRIASADKDAMQMGARMHRKIQRQMGSSYHPEVTMKIQIPFEGFTLQIEGRADGVMETDEGTVIDEIKGVFKESGYNERACAGTSCTGKVLCFHLWGAESVWTVWESR